MTEETKEARKQAPRAIVLAVYIGFATGFIFLIAATFCMGNVEDIASTSTGVPIIEVFYVSTGNVGGSSALATLILVIGVGASNGLTATAGRSIYAFARDNGLPFSGFLSKVHQTNATPINGLGAAVFVQMALIAIYFGAVQGFQTVIAIAVEGFCRSIQAFPAWRVANTHHRHLICYPTSGSTSFSHDLGTCASDRCAIQSWADEHPPQHHRPSVSALHHHHFQLPDCVSRQQREHELHICGRRRHYAHCTGDVADDRSQAFSWSREWRYYCITQRAGGNRGSPQSQYTRIII